MKYHLFFVVLIMCVSANGQVMTGANDCDSVLLWSQPLAYAPDWWSPERDGHFTAYKEFPSVGYFGTNNIMGSLGTGFLLRGGLVITCYHVAVNLEKFAPPIYFIVPGQNDGALADIIDSLPTQDIAIYRMRDSADLRGFEMGDFDEVNLLDTLDYAGCYSADTMFAGRAFVVEKGEAISSNGVYGVLLAFGVSWRGLSGSPLLNKNGDVVAILTGGMKMEKIKSSKLEESYVIRAHSISQIKKLIEKHAKPSATE